jgi:RNA polymerase sigma-70 factor, ECF subfamily
VAESRSTFEEVLSVHGDALWRLTSGYARQPADREDLYQEILVAMWGALPRFRGESSLRTFVFRVAHNRGMTFRGRVAARARREADVTVDLRDPRPTADESLHDEIDRSKLMAAVRELAPSLSQTVMLSLEGLTYAEIAAVLDITENNVGVRLHRARAALEKMLMAGDGS